MKNDYFADGTVRIGEKELAFGLRPVQGDYALWIPKDFLEDKNLISNYTYLFSQDKSPLSIAVKYSTTSGPVDRDKMIAHYFRQAGDVAREEACLKGHTVHYRETVTGGRLMSIYSLRFAVEGETGILFGCFNCSAEFREDWRGAVLAMLRQVERR